MTMDKPMEVEIEKVGQLLNPKIEQYPLGSSIV
jgi:hypothetical protein